MENNDYDSIKKIYEDIFSVNLSQHVSSPRDQETIVNKSREIGSGRTAWKLVETFLTAMEKFDPDVAQAFESLPAQSRIDIINSMLEVAKQVVRDVGAVVANRPEKDETMESINVMDQDHVDKITEKIMDELGRTTDQARIDQLLEQLKSINKKAKLEAMGRIFNRLAEVHMSGPNLSRCIYCIPSHLKDKDSNPVPGDANDPSKIYSDGLCNLWDDNTLAALDAGYKNIRNQMGEVANEKIREKESEGK